MGPCLSQWQLWKSESSRPAEIWIRFADSIDCADHFCATRSANLMAKGEEFDKIKKEKEKNP